MAVNSIDDLFQHELQQAHKAERSIVAALAKPGLIDVAQTKLLASFNAQARSRIARLEQVCKPTEFAADAAEDCFDAFDHQAAGIADQALLQRIALFEFQAALHHLLARYTVLAACAHQLHQTELAEMFDAIARELSAALVQVARAAPERDLQKSGLGERLTALFERKR